MGTSASPSTGTIADRYIIDRELGRGASSFVYLARDQELGRMVALKVLRPEFAESIAADRFLREIKVTAELEHPNIVPVLASGVHGRTLFFALPYMDGGTLRERLARDKQLPIEDVVEIGTTIAAALHFAHQRNLLHRDVKPENILFADGQACLSDFGIARAITRAAGDSTTTTGIVRGTPAYMSPEQASGDDEFDGRSDLYSLACVVYEALAGVPAFIGATPQSVMAQRITHPARPIRVYRPSVSPALEAMLAKALEPSPADRYQSGEAFASALREAAVASPPSRLLTRRRVLLGLGVGVGLLGIWSATNRGRAATAFDALDTTRVVVFPFERPRRAPDELGASELLVNGLHRWSGMSPVEDFAIADVVERHGPIRSDTDAARAARMLSAGRFVRGSVIGQGASRWIEAALYDVRGPRRLFAIRLQVPTDSERLIGFFDAAADSLIFRGVHDESRGPSDVGSQSIAAVQAFLSGRAALRGWDLTRADSFFVRSLQFDAKAVRPRLWLAQVRAWRAVVPADVATWRTAAEEVAADSVKLSQTERLMAAGLRTLADSDYTAACGVYQKLVRQDTLSFVGWYGLAQCHDLDHAVLADPKSPTGWHFRSSYHRAIVAYTRAFEQMPSSFNGFADGSFTKIRQKLYTSTRYLRSGFDLHDRSRLFYSRPSLNGDSVVFYPIPLGEQARPGSGADLASARPAVARLRQQFQQIAERWVVALPREPGAREALAISLETLGDPAAVDSFESVARTVSEPHQRLRLVVSSIVMRVKVSLPDRVDQLAIARNSADSILQSTSATTREDAELLSRLAALTGRCARAASLARDAATPLSVSAVASRAIMGDAYARLALVSLGCAIPPGLPTFEDLSRQLAALQPNPAGRQAAEFLVLSGIAQAMFPADSNLLKRIATAGGTLAELWWLRGDSRRARAILDSAAAARAASMPGSLTSEVALTQARLWLVLGDTTRAVEVLDQTLSGARYYAPMISDVANLFIVATLIRASALRADLARLRRDSTYRRWERAVDVLWVNADPEPRRSLHRVVAAQ